MNSFFQTCFLRLLGIAISVLALTVLNDFACGQLASQYRQTQEETFFDFYHADCCDPARGSTGGLSIRLHFDHLGGRGHKEWFVEVTRADGRPFKADRELMMEIHFGDYDSANSPTIRNRIELKQGSLKTNERFAVPSISPLYMYSAETRVFEDGNRLSGLELTEFYYGNGNSEQRDTLLVLPEKTEDIFSFTGRRGKNAVETIDMLRLAKPRFVVEETGRFSDLIGTSNLSRAVCLRSNFPEDWLLLSYFPSILLPNSALLELNGGQRLALRNFIASGGLAIVAGVDVSTIDGPNQLYRTVLGSDDPSVVSEWQANVSMIGTLEHSWFHRFSHRDETYPVSAVPNAWQGSASVDVSPWSLTEDVDELQARVDSKLILEALDWFAVGYLDLRVDGLFQLARSQQWLPQDVDTLSHWRQLYLGQDKLFDVEIGDLSQTIFTTEYQKGFLVAVADVPLDAMNYEFEVRLKQKQTTWPDQRGINLDFEDNSSYWRGLIVSVGKPPVIGFAIFIALFSLLIGPGVLLTVHRFRRQTWLMIIVPVIGLLSASALFGFAILKDGFATSARTRSFTTYDATTKSGFAWSYQTYFSGAPPADGMRFDRGSEVLPILLSNSRSPKTDIDISQDQQRWTQAIRAREQMQFLVRHPVDSLELFQSSLLADGTLELTNSSDSDWPFALFLGDGQCWIAQDLAAGSTQSIAVSTIQDEQTRLQLLLNMALPDPPFDTGSYSQRTLFEEVFGEYNYGRTNSSPSPIYQELETWKALIANPNFSARSLRHRFLLMRTEANYIDQAIETADLVESEHLVLGRWKP
jgi:hypothetical protein